MKKLLILFTALLSILTFGCSTDADEPNALVESITENAVISALVPSYYSGIMHSGDYVYPVSFSFKETDLITRDPTVYYKDFSKMGIVLATDIYETSRIEFTNKKSPSANNDKLTVFETLGFSDAEFHEAGNGAVEDLRDTENFVISHKAVQYNNEDYELFILSLRGTDSVTQWTSNFDVGSDTTEYYTITGTHSDWTNKKEHKGFSVAAKRVDALVQSYIAAHTTTGAKKIIYLTGHSRGAAVANILGAKYETSGAFEKTFTYTFAAPYTTTIDEADNTYKTVFNILNSDDAVVIMPPQQWGFRRYGITKKISVKNNVNLSTRWYELFSKGLADANGFYQSAGAEDPVFEASLAGISSDRDHLYTIGSNEDDLFKMTFETNEEATNARTDLQNLLVFQYSNMSITLEDGKHVLSGYIAPAFYMQILSNLITKNTNDTNPLDGIMYPKYITPTGYMVAAATYHGFEKSHQMATYYLLAEQF